MPVIMLAGIAAAGLLYHGHRFPAAVFSCAVHWYFQFQPRLRDLEALLFERGVVVSLNRFDAGATNSARALRVEVGPSNTTSRTI
jgi:putative transposase